jgi:hypothetical protein
MGIYTLGMNPIIHTNPIEKRQLFDLGLGKSLLERGQRGKEGRKKD